jgi:hypothetical protein
MIFERDRRSENEKKRAEGKIRETERRRVDKRNRERKGR